jgi:hypothetical protein
LTEQAVPVGVDAVTLVFLQYLSSSIQHTNLLTGCLRRRLRWPRNYHMDRPPSLRCHRRRRRSRWRPPPLHLLLLLALLPSSLKTQEIRCCSSANALPKQRKAESKRTHGSPAYGSI